MNELKVTVKIIDVSTIQLNVSRNKEGVSGTIYIVRINKSGVSGTIYSVSGVLVNESKELKNVSGVL